MIAMKVAITHLKAPWPAGAGVGAVVLLDAPIVPAWAAGKCVPLAADDEREADFVWQPPAKPAEPEFVVNPASEADRKAAELGALLEDQAQQLQDAQQALSTARAEIASLAAERDAAFAERDKARADLAAAAATKPAKKAGAA